MPNTQHEAYPYPDDEEWLQLGAYAIEQAEVGVAAVRPVHRAQDAVAARLDRQVEEGHQLFHLGMRADQPLAHVVGMAGRVADARQLRQPVERADQPVQALRAPRLVLACPGVDVLAQQRDLARAGVDQ